MYVLKIIHNIEELAKWNFITSVATSQQPRHDSIICLTVVPCKVNEKPPLAPTRSGFHRTAPGSPAQLSLNN